MAWLDKSWSKSLLPTPVKGAEPDSVVCGLERWREGLVLDVLMSQGRGLLPKEEDGLPRPWSVIPKLDALAAIGEAKADMVAADCDE